MSLLSSKIASNTFENYIQTSPFYSSFEHVTKNELNYIKEAIDKIIVQPILQERQLDKNDYIQIDKFDIDKALTEYGYEKDSVFFKATELSNNILNKIGRDGYSNSQTRYFDIGNWAYDEGLKFSAQQVDTLSYVFRNTTLDIAHMSKSEFAQALESHIQNYQSMITGKTPTHVSPARLESVQNKLMNIRDSLYSQLQIQATPVVDPRVEGMKQSALRKTFSDYIDRTQLSKALDIAQTILPKESLETQLHLANAICLYNQEFNGPNVPIENLISQHYNDLNCLLGNMENKFQEMSAVYKNEIDTAYNKGETPHPGFLALECDNRLGIDVCRITRELSITERNSFTQTCEKAEISAGLTQKTMTQTRTTEKTYNETIR